MSNDKDLKITLCLLGTLLKFQCQNLLKSANLNLNTFIVCFEIA